jgi:TIR domain
VLDISTFILIILGAPPAIQGVIDIVGRARIKFDDSQKSRKLKMLPEDPVGAGERKFYVKSTYAKYLLGEELTELTRIREIRVLEDVNQIKIDRIPAPGIAKADVAATEPFQFKQDCFAMPGVALKRGAYYQVDLGRDQIFKANTDQRYLINIKVREKLKVLHPDPIKDGIYIERPFGAEKLIAEVHFPPTRRLKKNDNKKVQLAVYEIRGKIDAKDFTIDGEGTIQVRGESCKNVKEIDAKHFTIDDEVAIQPVLGTITDMFRLTLRQPPHADLLIMWQWSVVEVPKPASQWRTAGTARPLKVFISYSHKDQKMLDRLGEHLSSLVSDKLIVMWKDREIEAGEDWEEKINKEIAAADIILLLVSAAFLASPYCRNELLRAIELPGTGKSVPIPIILRPCEWQTVFNRAEYKIQALPRNDKPVSGGGWSNQDAAYTVIAKELRAKFEKMRPKS